ncbi:MAG: hypothetical protein GX321_10885 [Clostridiales bacterium]|nr:hypothetical protein [Clostridiales bacterium]
MKKLWVILLILTMVLQPQNAYAASYVDLSRVKFSSGSEPLVFTFGDLNIDGVLMQIYPFTEDEINQLVQETLKSKNLTQLEIKEANEKVLKAKRASEFTKEDLERVKQNMLTTISAVPVGNVSTVLSAVTGYMGSSSWDDIGTASATLLENTTKDWVKDTAGGFVNKAGELGKNLNTVNAVTSQLLAIEKFCEMMVDEHARTKQKWKDIADGANAKRMLNEFYFALQNKIDSYKSKSDRFGWQIQFNDERVGSNFTFFGVDTNYQTWSLDMILSQEEKPEIGAATGTYLGVYSIRSRHEMSNFQSRAHEAILNMGEVGAAIKKMKETPGNTVNLSTVSTGSVYIERVINGYCQATIKEDGEITLTMEEESDQTVVNISGIEVEMDYSVIDSKIFNSGGKIRFQISADKEEIVIGGITADIFVKSPDVNFSHEISGSGTVNVGWDKGIWKHWDGTKKTLSHRGR